MKFFEENEAKLKTQLELLSKDRGDLSILLETLQHKTYELDKLEKFKASPQREIIISDDPRRRKFEELELENMEFIRNKEKYISELKNLREALERNKLDLEIERDLRNQYFDSIKELESILRELMNEGEMFRHHVKKTVTEENKKVLEKYRILLEEKPKE